MSVEAGSLSPGGSESLLLRLFNELPQELLEQALTHSSWVEERSQSYERLEFLGDSVLGLAIAAYLYQNFPGQPEGRLAKLKAYVVSRRSCAVVATRLGLQQLVLQRAPGDEAQRQELAANPVALGNILEALIGAVYLEKGFETASLGVKDAFSEQVFYGETYHVDYKSTLQEVLAAANQMARYELVKEEGPPHLKIFTSEVSIGGVVRGMGSGRSIKTSEQEAAREALLVLGVLSGEPPSKAPLGET
jgi:ribonuclease-3